MYGENLTADLEQLTTGVQLASKSLLALHVPRAYIILHPKTMLPLVSLRTSFYPNDVN
jgi:hypothetical protein